MTDSTDTKEAGNEVTKEEAAITEEEKPAEKANEEAEKETEKKVDEDVPFEDTKEVKEEATVNTEASTEKKDETTKEEDKSNDEPTPSTANDAELQSKDESVGDLSEPTKDKIIKAFEGGGEDTTSKEIVEAPTPKDLDATEVKKEEPVLVDDVMATEPKSELVAAAEADAKNNKDQPAPCESAVRPNNRDVLFGRGKPFQNHPGNRKMLSYIDQYKRQYNESPRDQKRPIVEEIIGILTSAGGRFLRRYNEDVNSTWWTEVPKQVAFDKVSHAFRSRGRPKASDSAAAKAALAARAAAAAVAHQGHPHQQHPHHPQHPSAYAPHHQGQYGGVPPPGAQFGGQFGQYGMPPGNFNPMIAAMQHQQHHNPMLGYHPMPGGISPQQQAMMQAGMMVAMQQQQQHAGGPPGAPPPPYYGQPPPPNPYYGQQPQHHQQPPPQQHHQPQEQANLARQQQHQPHGQAQPAAPGFPTTMYGGMNQTQAAGIAGGFLLPPQPGASPPVAQGFAPGVAPPPTAEQGEESTGKEVVI